MLTLRLLLAVLAVGLVVGATAAYAPHAPVERSRRQLGEQREPEDDKPVVTPGGGPPSVGKDEGGQPSAGTNIGGQLSPASDLLKTVDLLLQL